MKKIKLLVFIFAALIVATLWPVSALAEGTATFAISAPTVTVDGTVEVTVKVTGEKIQAWQFSLKYQEEYLTYESGADGGGAGILYFADSQDSPANSFTFKARFKAKKVGTTSLSIDGDDAVIVNENANKLNASGTSSNLTIKAKPVYSSDNTLKELSVSPGELTPAFQADVTNYAVTVPFNTTEIAIHGTPNHNKASISISSNQLKVGDNTVTLTVKAENGRTKTYTVVVTRTDSELAGVTVDVDGQQYSVEYDPDQLTPPDGYQEVITDFQDRQILAFSSPKNTAMIAFLHGEESGWFLFDPETDSFSPMVMVQAGDNEIVILSAPKGSEIPSGFVPESFLYQGKKIMAYTDDQWEECGILLIYGMAQDGTASYYYLDPVLGSLVSYFELPAISDPASGTPQGGDPNGQDALAGELFALRITTIALALVAVLLAVGLVLTFHFRRRPSTKKEDTDEYLESLMETKTTPEMKE